MGLILASTIATRAGVLLQDVNNDRWTLSEHLTAINDGQQAICLLKPDAYIVNVSYQLAAGTKQNIPDGTADYKDPDDCTIEAGIQLIDVVRNMGTTGTVPGNVITLVDMEQLDISFPGWHVETADATVVHYMFRETDPKRFYVYPQQPAASMGWIEIVMGAQPPNIALIGDPIVLDDIYFLPLLDYVMFRAFMRDADFAANAELAKLYYGNFISALVGKDTREKADSPNPEKELR